MTIPADNYLPTKSLGNGVTTDFPFTWTLLNEDYIRVFLENVTTGDQTEQVLGSDFSVDFDETSGTVTFFTAPTSDYFVIIAREVSKTQDTRYTTSEGFRGKIHEESFDKQILIDQDLQEESDRTIQFKLGTDTSVISNELPPLQQGQLLGWGADSIINYDVATGTPLPTLADTYIRRNTDNTAFETKTPTEVLEDIGGLPATEFPSSSAEGSYFVRNATDDGYDERTVSQVEGDLGVDILKTQTISGYLHVREEQPSGTDAGTSAAGVQTRVLNIVKTNTITGSSLSSNQITLPAGTYRASIRVPSFRSSSSRGLLYDVTNTANICFGSNSFSQTASPTADVYSHIECIFTLVGVTVLEIRQYCATAFVTQGLGVAVTSGDVEVYTDVFIEKIGV